MSTAETIYWIARYWLAAGGIVAALFLTIGIDRIDEDAQGAYLFRPLLVPGILLLWPLVIWRWWNLERGTIDPQKRFKPVRKSHSFVAIILGIAITGIILFGMTSRATWPVDFAPVKISENSEVSK